MVITKEQVEVWLQNGQQLGTKEAELLLPFVEKYPYYAPTQAVLAKAYYNMKSPKYENQLRKASLTADNRLWLYNYIHNQLNMRALQVEEEPLKIVLKKGEGEVIDHKETIDEEVLAAIKPRLVVDEDSAVEKLAEETVIETHVEDTIVIEAAEEVNSAEAIIELVPETEKVVETKGEDAISEDENIERVTSVADEPVEEIQLVIEETPEQEPIPLFEINEEVIVAEIEDTLTTEHFATEPIEILKPVGQLEVAPIENDELAFLDWLDYTGFEEEEVESSATILNTVEVEEEKASNIEKTADILTKFLASKPKPGEIRATFYSPEKMSVQSDLTDNIVVSETLAHVYLTQGEPEMAVSVYEKLALKFPQKNLYFASLIKELKEKHKI